MCISKQRMNTSEQAVFLLFQQLGTDILKQAIPVLFQHVGTGIL